MSAAMAIPPLTVDDDRLGALASYGILDTPPEPGFDDIVVLARNACATPVALVSLVDRDRQWFKARVGFPACETDLDSSVCAHALAEPDLLVIPDLTADPRTAANPLVTGEPRIRFYAGAPLRTPDGHAVGSLCVIDLVPRPGGLTTIQAESLRALARQVMAQMELRRTAMEREAYARTQQAVIDAGGDLDAILDALVAGVMRATPAAEGGALELVDGADLEYRAVAGTLAAHRGLRVPVADSASGACATTGAAILVRDASSDPRVRQAVARNLGQVSSMHLPVRRAGQVLGVLKLQSGRAGAFGERDLRVAELFAAIATAGLTAADEAGARRALDAGRQRQRAIFDSTTQFAIVVTDRDGRVTDWNSGAVRTFGWPAEDALGRGIDDIFTPEDRAGDRAGVEMRLSTTQGRASDERWHVRRDGGRFWASGEMMPLRDAAGAHQGYVKVLRDRTAEHLAGLALERAEAGLRRAQEVGGIGLFTVDMASNLLQPSAEFCRLYGLPVRDGYPATAFEALVIPEDAHLVSTAAARERGEHAREVEYRIRRPDTGEVRWIARRGDVERDGSGCAVRFSGAARDVTERRAADEARRAAEERFRAILDTVETAFAVVEVEFDADDRPVDYRFVEANPAFVRQAGVDLRGKRVTEFAPDLERFWFETYGRVALTGEPASFENYAEAFGRWFDVRAVRVGDPAERRIAILFDDVTERREAEERLRASEALARENVDRVQLALAAGAIIGTWFWDLPSDRFTVDEAFAVNFGLDPALGREGIPLARIVDTVHPDDQTGLAAAIDEAIRRGGAYAHQYRVRRADGNYYWLEANGRVEHGADGTPLRFPGVLIDVDERRAVEAERDRALAQLRALTDTLEQRVRERGAELMQAEEALRQSQKMEAVGQLTGGLAHDFNNLLAGISGSLELMGNRIDQGRLKDIDKYMVAAQGATKRAAALTHRLLAFSRRQTLEPKATDVNALVVGMMDLIRRTVGPGIPVETVGASDLWPALVDPSQLENALLNLCINARDAMPDGGRITVETANRWIDRHAAREQDMPEGQYLAMSVTDTGVGMPPDVVAKAFDPFFTTKPVGQGTGLGLSMIYGFAKQSGGQVRIYSEVGRGTTVCVYLPRHRGEAVAAEAGPERGMAPMAEAGETVLVVDDEPTVRLLVTDVLEDLGYVAIEASDSAGGLRVLRSDARVDLLVTDVGLPGGMNGRQMADAARETRPDLRVLFITGYAENALLNNGHLEPGMSVLTKPFAVDTLAARIRELISQQRV